MRSCNHFSAGPNRGQLETFATFVPSNEDPRFNVKRVYAQSPGGRFMTRFVVSFASVMLLVPPLAAAELKSGPQPGNELPGSFNVLNINGPQAGKSNCQV
jgi:hypothetical protein